MNSTRQATVPLVEEAAATGKVAEIFADIRQTKGIAFVPNFWRTLASLGVEVVGFRTFPDHHPYSARDVEDLRLWARGLAAELVLTTQKDLVKLRIDRLGPIPLRAVRIGLEVLEGSDELDQSLAALLPADRPTGKDSPCPSTSPP